MVFKAVLEQAYEHFKTKKYEEVVITLWTNSKTLITILLIMFWIIKTVLNGDNLFLLNLGIFYLMFSELLCFFLIKESFREYIGIFLAVVFTTPALVLYGRAKPFILAVWDPLKVIITVNYLVAFTEGLIRKYPKFSYSLLLVGAGGTITYGGAVISDYITYKEMSEYLAIYETLDADIIRHLENRWEFKNLRDEQFEAYKSLLHAESKLIFPKFKGYPNVFEEQLNLLKAQNRAAVSEHNKVVLDSMIAELMHPEDLLKRKEQIEKDNFEAAVEYWNY